MSKYIWDDYESLSLPQRMELVWYFADMAKEHTTGKLGAEILYVNLAKYRDGKLKAERVTKSVSELDHFERVFLLKAVELAVLADDPYAPINWSHDSVVAFIAYIASCESSERYDEFYEQNKLVFKLSVDPKKYKDYDVDNFCFKESSKQVGELRLKWHEELSLLCGGKINEMLGGTK